MKRNWILIGAVVSLCVIAFHFGRAYQRPKPVASVLPVVSSPAQSPSVAPPDFGCKIYRDLATLAFPDLYEALRTAPPSSRLEWLHQIEGMAESPKKIAALCAFFRALVQADPNAAGDLILQVKRHRGPAIHEMVYSAPPAAMPRLAEILLKLPHEARQFNLGDDLGMALDEWAQVDPEAVLRFIAQHERKEDDADGETREDKLSFQGYGPSVINAWAGIDHEAALKWIETQPVEISDSVRESWVSGWFEADHDAAISYALAHLQDNQIREALSGFGLELFEENESKATDFLTRLPTSELRREAMSSIARQVGFRDACPPAAVVNFIVQFPIAEWPENVGSVVEHWLMTAPNEVLDWIRHQPPEMQTGLIEQYPVPSLDLTEPERDLLPILQLPRSDFRTRLLHSVIPRLKGEDSSVRQIVEQMNISPAEKNEIRPLLPPDGPEATTVSRDPEEAQ